MNELYLGDNEISNLWPLKFQVNLEGLYVNNNIIIDIGVVKYLTSLKTFVFADNGVINISTLKNLQLDDVDLQNNYITDLKLVETLPNRYGYLEQKELLEQYPRISKVVQGIFNSNDQNQNTKSKLKQTRRKIIQFEEQTSKIVQKAVLNQISFTDRVVNLFQSIE
ncbi:leucine-rich_repeat domain-containing protein [Hexamita inflata]|uniref:Leucine-rich_repeat domain-containing protein n=1 Tax=Hexamita inflata TaxID=28002 RepID=A0ABP1J530_9EUKA